MSIQFKTSEECRVELVAHTVMAVDLKAAFRPSHDDPLATRATFTPSAIAALDANLLPVSAARASFQNEDKTGASFDKDIKLMKSLARDGHVGPFEHNHATFIVECPLFIRSQIMRHRTGAYNEWSRRYTSEKIGFWIPDKWRAQSKSNKQASTDDEVRNELWVDTDFGDGGTLLRTEPNDSYYEGVDSAIWSYEQMLAAGCCREQARAVLPQSLLTQFYMTMNLRNWVHFLKLRLDSHAQKEVQIVARKIESQLRELWPEAMGVLLPEEVSPT